MSVGEDALVRVCDLDDLEEGEIFKADLAGAGPLAVYRVGDDVFVSSDTCTHGEASLSEDGFVEGYTVTCSWHDGTFDIRTGEPTSLPCMVALKTFAVTVRDEQVFISL
jgi:nitrite reductase/ring-hydroxylating ferredoxin subunit